MMRTFLCSRFLINVPEEESRDPIRLLFQVELAHWFYLDFYCPENPELRTCGIKEFAIQDILCSLVITTTNFCFIYYNKNSLQARYNYPGLKVQYNTKKKD